jgi:hypothetical protein
MRGVEAQVAAHGHQEARAVAAAGTALAEDRDRAVCELRIAEGAARAANAEGSVLRAVTSGVEAEAERYRSEEECAERALRVLRLEVSGARSELEKSRAQELRIEAETRVELHARMAAEVRFADESKAQSEEFRNVFHRGFSRLGELVRRMECAVGKRRRMESWRDTSVDGVVVRGFRERRESRELCSAGK